MIAHKLKPETAAVAVIPAEHKHAQGLSELSFKTYHVAAENKDSWFKPEEYISRINMFPEGQFVAIHTQTHEIVGYTSGMRLHFDATKPLLTSWDETTGYG